MRTAMTIRTITITIMTTITTLMIILMTTTTIILTRMSIITRATTCTMAKGRRMRMFPA